MIKLIGKKRKLESPAGGFRPVIRAARFLVSMVQLRWNRLLHWTEDAFAPGWLDLGGRGRRRPYRSIQRRLALDRLLAGTLKGLRPRLADSGYITERLISEFDNLYSDPRFWTSAITFVAAWGRKPVVAR